MFCAGIEVANGQGMAQTTYRCNVCSSEILASRPLPAPHVCLLCRLSAEEAVAAVEEQKRSRGERLRLRRVGQRSADQAFTLS
jgi:hypothetical protein